MNWVDIVVLIIIIITFFSGLKEGAVKNLFTGVAILIAIPIAGRFYYLLVYVLSFLPGTNWENFVGFFITLGLINVIFHFIFFLPRKIIEKITGKEALSRLLGGALGVFNTSVGFAVFVLALRTFPIISWLEENVSNSGVLTWLVETLEFIQSMLPEVFHQTATMV